jgi:hypothetical protein
MIGDRNVAGLIPDWGTASTEASRRGEALKVGSTIAGVMPTVFCERGFRFFFYSNECSPRESVHIHVEKGGVEAKFWLNPVVTLAYNDGYRTRTVRELRAIIESNRDLIERTWNEFFG